MKGVNEVFPHLRGECRGSQSRRLLPPPGWTYPPNLHKTFLNIYKWLLDFFLLHSMQKAGSSVDRDGSYMDVLQQVAWAL